MKPASREDVEIRWYTDDKFTGTRTEKNRCIYKRKDGTEYVACFGDVTRGPDGKPFVERRCISGQPISIVEYVKKMKEAHDHNIEIPGDVHRL